MLQGKYYLQIFSYPDIPSIPTRHPLLMECLNTKKMEVALVQWSMKLINSWRVGVFEYLGNREGSAVVVGGQ